MRLGRMWATGILGVMGAAVLATALLSGCGDDKKKTTGPGDEANPVVTEAMAGRWSYTVVAKDCQSGTQLLSQTVTDTLCVGDRLGDAIGGDPSTDCTVTQNGNTYHVHCTSSETEEGCKTVTTIDFDMSYTNTTINATGLYTATDTPTGCALFAGSYCITITGTRTGDLPAGACN